MRRSRRVGDAGDWTLSRARRRLTGDALVKPQVGLGPVEQPTTRHRRASIAPSGAPWTGAAGSLSDAATRHRNARCGAGTAAASQPGQRQHRIRKRPSADGSPTGKFRPIPAAHLKLSGGGDPSVSGHITGHRAHQEGARCSQKFSRSARPRSDLRRSGDSRQGEYPRLPWFSSPARASIVALAGSSSMDVFAVGLGGALASATSRQSRAPAGLSCPDHRADAMHPRPAAHHCSVGDRNRPTPAPGVRFDERQESPIADTKHSSR